MTKKQQPKNVRDTVAQLLAEKDGTYVHPLVQNYAELAAAAFAIAVDESDISKDIRAAKIAATKRENIEKLIAERNLLKQARQNVVNYVKATEYYQKLEADALSIEDRFLNPQKVDGLEIPAAMEGVYKDQVNTIRGKLSNLLAASKGDLEARIEELNDLIGDNE